MPHIKTDDGVNLWVEEHGSGAPVVFAHEFGGDIRSWEPQLRHFARNYRTIAFNARGYPPSDVPEDVSMYGQFRAVDDILAVLDGLGIDKAHIVGLSMGGFAALHFGFRYPDRALSLTWGESALQRGTLSPPPESDNRAAPRYSVRGGRENAGSWWLETVDLYDLYHRSWPKDDAGKTQVVFIGVAAAGNRPPAPAYISGIVLSR